MAPGSAAYVYMLLSLHFLPPCLDGKEFWLWGYLLNSQGEISGAHMAGTCLWDEMCSVSVGVGKVGPLCSGRQPPLRPV